MAISRSISDNRGRKQPTNFQKNNQKSNKMHGIFYFSLPASRWERFFRGSASQCWQGRNNPDRKRKPKKPFKGLYALKAASLIIKTPAASGGIFQPLKGFF